jgi:hypothetical protein
MPPKLTQAQFLERARSAHGEKYDYSQVRYQTLASKVTILCPTHGSFEQTAEAHAAGFGCVRCTQNSYREHFSIKASRIHDNKYDYSQAAYISNVAKVTIICPIHGPFQQSPSNHLMGRGCAKCSKCFKGGTQYFIERARQIHGNRYDYSSTEYLKSAVNTTIICCKHGPFQQTPNSHLGGKGCVRCAQEAGSAWIASRWAARQAGRTAILYIVRLSGNDEVFYKAGITLRSIKKRFMRARFPYCLEPIATFSSSDAIAIHKAEALIKRRFKALIYQPLQRFQGYTECYTSEVPLISFLSTQNDIERTY